MLLLKSKCEKCEAPLAATSGDARICSFECTFCAACADGELAGICPNCGGELVTRPRRPATLLESFPPTDG
jgi:hypothetical protein